MYMPIVWLPDDQFFDGASFFKPFFGLFSGDLFVHRFAASMQTFLGICTLDRVAEKKGQKFDPF